MDYGLCIRGYGYNLRKTINKDTWLKDSRIKLKEIKKN